MPRAIFPRLPRRAWHPTRHPSLRHRLRRPRTPPTPATSTIPTFSRHKTCLFTLAPSTRSCPPPYVDPLWPTLLPPPSPRLCAPSVGLLAHRNPHPTHTHPIPRPSFLPRRAVKVADALVQYYEEFVTTGEVEYVNTIASGHTFPTDNSAVPYGCGSSSPPYLSCARVDISCYACNVVGT